MLVARPYQNDGIKFLSSRNYACLWDEPGLGKSFQALSAAKNRSADDLLIICPASVRLAWALECQKLDLDFSVVLKKNQIRRGINICSYDGAAGALYEELHSRSWDLIICDEEHYLKGYNTRTITQNGRKIKVPPLRVEKILGRKCNMVNCLGEKSDAIWGLTGTPMPNDPSELYPVIRAKFPDAIIKQNNTVMSYWDFVGRYCRTFDNGYGIKIIGGKNLPKLRDELRGRVCRRTKLEVANDLPDVQYAMLPVEAKIDDLPEEEMEIIKACIDSDDPMKSLKANAHHVAQLRRLTGLAKAKSIVKWIEETEHDKMVVFAHHRAVINELRKIKNSVHIDGSCSQSQRVHAVKAFQEGGARVFIGQIQAAGTGLTLTAASTLIFAEYDWVPANNRQAADRIHRIGQKNNCLVYMATVPGSIDEDIMKVVKRKMETYKEMGL